MTRLQPSVALALRAGQVIPAHPLAVDRNRRLDEQRQRALTRYYVAAGAGGVAVGVHTTQFAIREAKHALLRPVLELAVETLRECEAQTGVRPIRIAGVCGQTTQAIEEASLARDLGYDLGLLSLEALPDASESELIAHARIVAETLPVCGFYLQSAVGGRDLSYAFWRRLVEIDGVVAIKVAPFDRYKTLDVLRAVADSGRTDLALYTGNDDHIVGDLTTEFCFGAQPLRFAGGLLGHWAVWTRAAVRLLEECHATKPLGARFSATRPSATRPLAGLIAKGVAVTDCNAVFFDAANGYRGCIAGLHEVLRRQGLLAGTWCLDPNEGLSPGQIEAIDRVYAAYPDLNDDAFVAENLDSWLS